MAPTMTTEKKAAMSGAAMIANRFLHEARPHLQALLAQSDSLAGLLTDDGMMAAANARGIQRHPADIGDDMRNIPALRGTPIQARAKHARDLADWLMPTLTNERARTVLALTVLQEQTRVALGDWIAKERDEADRLAGLSPGAVDMQRVRRLSALPRLALAMDARAALAKGDAHDALLHVRAVRAAGYAMSAELEKIEAEARALAGEEIGIERAEQRKEAARMEYLHARGLLLSVGSAVNVLATGQPFEGDDGAGPGYRATPADLLNQPPSWTEARGIIEELIA